jgi:AraC-like DNA-binding protein
MDSGQNRRIVLEGMIDSYLRDCFERESPPRVDELATSLEVTPRALSRRFHREAGMGLADYLKQRQVDFAERLLLESDLTVTHIAYRAGFGTRRTFFRVYQRLRGRTPESYRLSMKVDDVNTGQSKTTPYPRAGPGTRIEEVDRNRTGRI